MPDTNGPEARLVKAFHGLQELKPDPDFEIGLADHLRAQYSREALLDLYARFAVGDGSLGHVAALANPSGTRSAQLIRQTQRLSDFGR